MNNNSQLLANKNKSILAINLSDILGPDNFNTGRQ